MQNTIAKRIGLATLLLIVLLLSGCGGLTAQEDPLLDYSADVVLPHRVVDVSKAPTPTPTMPVYKPIVTGATSTTGWLGEVVPISAYNTYTDLSFGAVGQDVKALQVRLIELGYMTGTASGTFNAATVQAVKQFEATYDRTPTGNATPLMQMYLYANNVLSAPGQASPSPTVTPSPSISAQTYLQLERNDQGESVRQLQNRLIELGYLAPGSASGRFDEATENAVKNFEAAYGRQRTGIATPALQYSLYSANAFPYGTTPTPTVRVATPTPSMTPISYGKLQRGSNGESVVQLQARLRELGYLTGSVDGIYGAATEEAVRRFEALHGQTETGVASSSMQRYLFSDSARAYTDPTPTPTLSYPRLSNGSSGADVVALQQRLIQLGYLSGVADGQFGRATEAAVKKFEKAYGVTQTGVATAMMQTYLFAANALPYLPPVSTPTPTPAPTASSSAYSTLSLGSSGPLVYALQTRLIDLRYLTGPATGTYDAATVDAVKRFEAAYRQPETGIATPTVQSYLYAADARVNPNNLPAGETRDTLQSKSKGEAVQRLQERLIALGYLSGKADGIFGTKTTQAIKRFQSAIGLAQTGIATPDLQDQLFSSEAPTYQSVQTAAITVVNRAAIVMKKVAVYESASTDSEKLGTLAKGTIITLLRAYGDWAEVKNSSDSIGYVKIDALAPADEVSDPTDGDGGAAEYYTELNYGDTGAAVKRLQTRLTALGYFDGALGGNYKTLTQRSVKAFQQAIGYTTTGVATVALQQILYSDAAPAANAYSQVITRSFIELSYGSSGPDVTALQTTLYQLGYLAKSGTKVGTFDAPTQSAVVDVQLAMGMEGADGVASPELQAFLCSDASAAITRAR